MECEDECDFESKASRFIYRIAHYRGFGFGKFNKIDCYNHIASTIGHQMIFPQNQKQIEQVQSGTFFYYGKEAEKHAADIYGQMITLYNDKSSHVEFKIIPLALYIDKEMFTFPLFYVNGEKGSVYIDTASRKYESFKHWRETNTHPSGIIAYPRQLIWDNGITICFEKTKASELAKKLKSIIETIALGYGFASLLPGLILPKGSTVMTAVLLYGFGTKTFNLYDRYVHGQPIGLTDPEARRLWLNLCSSGFSCITIGVLWRVSVTASKGAEFGSTAIQLIDILNVSNHLTALASFFNDTVYVFANWKNIPLNQKLTIVANVACLLFRSFNFKSAEQLINEFRAKSVDQLMKGRSEGDHATISVIRNQTNGDLKLLKLINETMRQFNLTEKTALDRILNGKFSQILLETEYSQTAIGCQPELHQNKELQKSSESEIPISQETGSETNTDSTNNIYQESNTTEQTYDLNVKTRSLTETTPQSPKEVSEGKEKLAKGTGIIIQQAIDFVKEGKFKQGFEKIKNLPGLIEKLIPKDMGFKLKPEQIQSISKPLLGLFGISCTVGSTGMTICENGPGQYPQNSDLPESYESVVEKFGFDAETTPIMEFWIRALLHHQYNNPNERLESIKDLQVYKKLIGLTPIKNNIPAFELKIFANIKDKDWYLGVIEHAKLKFGSEETAINSYLSNGFINTGASIDKLLDIANELVCQDNFVLVDNKSDCRLFYYENKLTEDTAIVSEQNGYLKFNCVKIKQIESNN